MKTYNRSAVMQLSEHLHLCMVKAIDTALTDRIGANWFSQFKEFDFAQQIPVLEKEYTNVNSMDLQSCFKFFRYRDDYAKIVFEYYGHNFFLQTDDAIKAQNQLNNLLDNLIRNVRNYLYAHASATMVESGVDSSLRYSVYGATEAVNDMLKFAGFFDKVTDNDGISYYRKMLNVSHKTNVHAFSIIDTIKKNNLKVSNNDFISACQNFNIPVSTNDDGALVFSTSNYEGDLAKIALYLKENNIRKKKKILIPLVIVIILIICAVITALILFLKDDPSDKSPESAKSDESISHSDTEIEEEVNEESDDLSIDDEYIYGTGTNYELTLTVNQTPSDDITIFCENGANHINLGWSIKDVYFIIETESGNFRSAKLNKFTDRNIVPYETRELEIKADVLDGERIVSISCDNFCLLDQDGLPTGDPFEIYIPIEYIS